MARPIDPPQLLQAQTRVAVITVVEGRSGGWWISGACVLLLALLTTQTTTGRWTGKEVQGGWTEWAGQGRRSLGWAAAVWGGWTQLAGEDSC